MSENLNKHKRKPSRFTSLFKSYMDLKRHTKDDDIEGMYNDLLNLQPVYGKKEDFYSQLGNLAYRKKDWQRAIDHFNIAIQLAEEPVDTKYYLLKAESYINLGESLEAITCWEEYLSVHSSDKKVWYKLAIEYNNLKKLEKAIESYESYLELSSEDSEVHFRLAECFKTLNNTVQAEFNYAKAANNYNETFSSQSLAIVYYHLGLMRQKNNKSSDSSYNKAIELDRELKSDRFGIGVFHEHFKEWNSAIESFENLLQTKTEDVELLFKLASLLNKIKKPEKAVGYYEKALELDKVKSPWHFALANCYEQLEDYENAAKSYTNAIERQEKHRPGNYRRLGYVLNKLGRTEEALAAYEEAEAFRKPSFMGKKKYEKYIKQLEVRYGICYEHYSIDNKMIIYGSSGGRLTDNPFAIFKQLLKNDEFKDFTHVWIVNSFLVIPKEFRSLSNVIYVKKDSDAAQKYLASAKYLICNAKFPDYFIRKPDQQYLQTSHGVFYKTMGRDQTNAPLGSMGGTHNLLQATHIIMPNDFMVDKQRRCYSIQGINSGKIAKIGYPRIDSTLNKTKNDKLQLDYDLGLDPSKKTVFYAPTWRGSLANKKMDSERLIKDLHNLADLDINMVFRGHTFSNKLLKDINLPENIIVPPIEIQTNDLLSISDVLITDYSSVFFDFLATEKPIVHYLYDIEEYIKERGLNLTENELPGSVVKAGNELIDAVTDSLNDNEPDSHYMATKARFCPFDDGKSTERIINWFFYGREEGITFVNAKNNTNSHLYLGGALKEKSILNGLLSEANELDKQGETVSILLNKGIDKDEDKFSFMKKLRKDINLIPNNKLMVQTLEEIEAIEFFNKTNEFKSEKMKLIYNRAFIREARRLLGDSRFDQVYNCETYSNYGESLSENVLKRK